MSNTNPRISIILPIFNVEPYLRECLDSVVNQTLHEIEIIGVNDGSTDGSLAILEEYAERDTRIVVLNKENGGQSDARNFGLKVARGKYVAFVDPDDFIELDLCEKSFQKAEETDAEAVIFQYDRFQNNCFLPEIFKWSQSRDFSILERVKLFTLPSVSVCKTLWKRDFLVTHQLTFAKGLLFEDIPFSFHASMLCENVELLPSVLYHYRCRPQSTTSSTRHYYDFSVEALSETAEKLRACNASEEVWTFFTQQKLDFWAHSYRAIPKNLRKLYCKKVRAKILPEDICFLRENRNTFKPYHYQCLILIGGRFKERVISRLKLMKYHLADKLVQKLIPHSDWLQSILQRNEMLEEEIERKSASLS